MIGLFNRKPTLVRAIRKARKRTFAGVVLDGEDLPSLIAQEQSPEVLEQAIELAGRDSEKIWAERFARRLHEISKEPKHRLPLAKILTAAGRTKEARALLPIAGDGEIAAEVHQLNGVLLAKEGRTKEAFEIFDTLPGGNVHHPAPIVLTVAQEMISQCEVPHSLALAKVLHEKYPAHLLVRAVWLRLQLYAGNHEAALELTKITEAELQKATQYERRAFVEAVAEFYDLSGWVGTLFEYAKDRIEKDPAHWRLYAYAGNSAKASGNDREFADIVDTLRGRNEPDVLALTGISRINTNRREDAKALMQRLRPLSAARYLELKFYYDLNVDDQDEIAATYDLCERCGMQMLGSALGYALHTYYYNCSMETLQSSLTKLEGFRHEAHTSVFYWQTYFRCLIGFKRVSEAERLYRTLPAGLANSAMLKPFSMYFDGQRGEHDRAKRDWTKYLRDTRHRSINARASYPRTVDLKYREKPGAVLLFVCIFNGATYIEWFLDHYRKLGVDHFFVVDNNSTDGGAEMFRRQPDVSLFSSPDSFAGSAFGIFWLNHLIQRFGIGHWCFQVDMDEAFVFPGFSRGRRLADLIAYCEARGFGAVRGFALDMYPERLSIGEGDDLFAQNCYFDTDYFSVGAELPPYVMVQGGLRQRMTGLALSMHKVPLIRAAADTRYIECNHSTTHLPMADVTGAVLHYKFVGDIAGRIKEAVDREEHFGGSVLYRRLDKSLAGKEGGSLLSPFSRKYEDSQSLVATGLIHSSPEWDSFRT